MWLCPSHAPAIVSAFPFIFCGVSWHGVELKFSLRCSYCLWSLWMGLLERSWYSQPCHPQGFFLPFPWDNLKHFLDDRRRIFIFSAVFYSLCTKSYACKELYFAHHLHQYSAGFLPCMNIFRGSRSLFTLLLSRLVYNKNVSRKEVQWKKKWIEK